MSMSARTMIGFVLVAGLLWWMRAAEAERADLVRIDRSSTVFPVTEAMAEEFHALSQNL